MMAPHQETARLVAETGTGGAPMPAPEVQVAGRVARVRVLVVDDSIGYGVLVAAWLDSHQDLEVVGAVRTADEALEALVISPPDVLMLDHFLPDAEHSGRVLDHVRARWPTVAVILVSGMPVHALGDVAAAVGADHFISKAADAEALATAIQVGVAHRARTWPAHQEA
jgi:DNA-binding NarL/FixJ family response regulator